jgi:hypothetical protein
LEAERLQDVERWTQVTEMDGIEAAPEYPDHATQGRQPPGILLSAARMAYRDTGADWSVVGC